MDEVFMTYLKTEVVDVDRSGDDIKTSTVEVANITHIRQLLDVFKQTALAAGFTWVSEVEVVAENGIVWSTADGQ